MITVCLIDLGEASNIFSVFRRVCAYASSRSSQVIPQHPSPRQSTPDTQPQTAISTTAEDMANVQHQRSDPGEEVAFDHATTSNEIRLEQDKIDDSSRIEKLDLEQVDTIHDPVFGEISADGPNYRNVSHASPPFPMFVLRPRSLKPMLTFST